jgi:hypothetical protein
MITHPGDGGHPDGLNWLTLDESGKNAYICGFIEGLFQGHCFTTWGLPGERQDDPSYINATRSFNDHWDRFIANASYRQFLEGLDRFYAEERNSKIEIQHGMWIVMNEIGGMPRTNLERMIDAWRQTDGK